MDYTRRNFIRAAIGACAGLAAPGSILSMVGCASKRWMQTDRTYRRVLSDIHVHSGMNKWLLKTPMGIKYPLITKMAQKFINTTGMNWKDCHEAGVDLICAAHFNLFDEWLSMPTDPDPEAPAHTHYMIDEFEKDLRENARDYARLVRNRGELQQLLKIAKTDPRFRVAVIHTLEGGHALGGDIKAIAPLAVRGVAMITVTHFFSKGIASAANSFPFFPDAGSAWPNKGLSEFGREVIEEMERRGVIVDITHATPTAVEDILKKSQKPLVASHASVYTLADHPYSLYDEHIEEIANKNGLIGVALYPYIMGNFATHHDAVEHGSLGEVVRTIRYIHKLCGTHKNIAIGSDFSGFIAGPTDMSRLKQIGRLRTLLVREFDNEQIVEDIMADNAINFLIENWGRTADR